MVGRKPKSAKLRLLEGNPGKRRIPKEPKPSHAADPIDCPPTLTAPAREEWNRLCEDMRIKGVLTTWDRGTMAAYCQSYADWMEAQAKVNQIGQIVKAPHSGVPMQNPYLSISRGAKSDMLHFAAELGLTPVARARLGASEERPESAGDVPPELRDVSGGS
jgi:P27 family predicted phage terminase small subunit